MKHDALTLSLFAEPVAKPKVAVLRPHGDACALFNRGCDSEFRSATEAREYYQMALRVDPTYASAWLNLGTLAYDDKDYAEAERCYKAALGIDPKYAMALFDLGNVYDEIGRLSEAVEVYKRAASLGSTDSHYNLGLLYERMGHAGKALKHWRAYLKRDRFGAWASYAQGQILKRVEASGLKLVKR